jgi:transcriptional regulator with XRE-family HTH domain
MDLENVLLGKKLKTFRDESGLSLTQVSDTCGLSGAFISMVENGKSGISFKSLHSLLSIYGKNLNDLGSVSMSDKIVNLEHAPTIAVDNQTILQALCSTKDGAYVGGFRLLIEPGGENEFDQHQGIDYTFVLDGEVELILEDENGNTEIRQLSKGDTTVHHSTLKHCWHNTGDDVASIFIMEIGNKEG